MKNPEYDLINLMKISMLCLFIFLDGMEGDDVNGLE